MKNTIKGALASSTNFVHIGGDVDGDRFNLLISDNEHLRLSQKLSALFTVFVVFFCETFFDEPLTNRLNQDNNKRAIISLTRHGERERE